MVACGRAYLSFGMTPTFKEYNLLGMTTTKTLRSVFSWHASHVYIDCVPSRPGICIVRYSVLTRVPGTPGPACQVMKHDNFGCGLGWKMHTIFSRCIVECEGFHKSLMITAIYSKGKMNCRFVWVSVKARGTGGTGGIGRNRYQIDKSVKKHGTSMSFLTSMVVFFS